MKSIRAILFIITSISCPVVLFSQAITSRTEKKDTPQLSTWFLATGNWETDPQLFVTELGTGSDTVIMLHGGWGAEHSGLLNAVTGLDKKFHFVFYDQRGSLRSPCPDSIVSYSNHIEDLELLRKELGLKKLNIVGHSMGAVLAGAYASRYPERVSKLVLVAPARLRFPILPKDTLIREQSWIEREPFMKRREVHVEMEKFGLTRTTSPLNSREETINYRIGVARRMLYDVSKWTLLNDGKAFFKPNLFSVIESTYPEAGWNFIENFKTAAYSVSIIVGDHDFLDFNARLAKHWTSEAPKIKLTVIEKAGHVIWIDQPTSFQKALIANLQARH